MELNKEDTIATLMRDVETAEETENEQELLDELEQTLQQLDKETVPESWSARIARTGSARAEHKAVEVEPKAKKRKLLSARERREVELQVAENSRRELERGQQQQDKRAVAVKRDNYEHMRKLNIERCKQLQSAQEQPTLAKRVIRSARPNMEQQQLSALGLEQAAVMSRDEAVIEEQAQSLAKQQKLREVLQGSTWKSMHFERSAIARRGYKSTEDMTRLLEKWCVQNDISCESDFRYEAEDWVAELMLDSSFTESLQRAVSSSAHRIYCKQRNRWHWTMQLAQSLVVYKPSMKKTHPVSVGVSAAKWEALLAVQSIDALEFAQAVYNWLQEVDYKRNCLLLWGEVSTGKTLFANAVRGLLLHRHLCNSNGSSNFALGNCLNTHIIIYEEPFLHPTLLEDMKSLCGGAHMTVDAKYSQQQNLRRTPVLITSNTLSLSKGHASQLAEKAIRERSYIFNFNTPIGDLLQDKQLFFEPIDLACFLHKYEPQLTKQSTNSST